MRGSGGFSCTRCVKTLKRTILQEIPDKRVNLRAVMHKRRLNPGLSRI